MSYAQQHILLVDDDPGILVAVKQALAAHGYEVTTATNGLEAWLHSSTGRLSSSCWT